MLLQSQPADSITDQLTAAFAGLTFFIVIVGTFVGWSQLSVIARQQRHEGATDFFDSLRRTRAAREYVTRDFPRSTVKLKKLTPEQMRLADEVINFLNETAYLLEMKIIERALVFRVSHTAIIRLAYNLGPYVRIQEERFGGRYARRVEEFASRAQLFHDVHPHHRRTTVRIFDGHRSRAIYSTRMPTGRWSTLATHIGWTLRRWTARY